MAEKICFVSDLHLFSRRSIANQYVSELRAAAKRSDMFVFGGDIFDFKWSRVGSFEHSVLSARKWIEDFIHPNTNCHFHYLLGNHDCCKPFVVHLRELSQSVANLDWHSNLLRVGSSIFLHGDVIDSNGTQSELDSMRTRWACEQPRGMLPNIAYDVLVLSRLHRAAAKYLNSPTRVSNQLLQYLIDVGHGPESGTTEIFYGHTHWMNDFERQGIRFRNCGAPIKGLPFKFIEIEIET